MGNICHAGGTTLGSDIPAAKSAANGPSKDDFSHPEGTSETSVEVPKPGPTQPETQSESSADNQQPAPAKPAPTFGRDPNLRREDFIFSNIKSPSCLARMPGCINGQQFLIEDCNDCDLFVLDNCSNVQIDYCERCRIFVGPCEGSLFMRNCKGCTIICAVQQFRTRDCEDTDVYLYSSTETVEPIIETSKNLRLGCFPLSYFSLQQQMARYNFSVWNNKWSEVYNFTPDHGDWTALPMVCSQTPLTPSLRTTSFEDGVVALWGLPIATAEDVGLTVEAKQLIVPITLGPKARNGTDSTLIVCFIKPTERLMIEFVQAMVNKSEDEKENAVQLLQTRQMQFSSGQQKDFFKESPDSLQVAQSAGSEASVIMEFQGAKVKEYVHEVLQDAKFASDAATRSNIYVSPTTEEAKRLTELAFETWKVVV